MAAFLPSIAGVRADDVIYLYLPLYHSAGFLMGLCGAIEKGDLLLRNTSSVHTQVKGHIVAFSGKECSHRCLLFSGITIALRRKFSASQFWNDCRKYNVTVIQYIGEIMRYLCNTPKVKVPLCLF